MSGGDGTGEHRAAGGGVREHKANSRRCMRGKKREGARREEG
jgi:hypothetical protein